jgi:hypothetical protein
MIQVDRAIRQQLFAASARPRVVSRARIVAAFALAALFSGATRAEPAADRTDVNHSRFEIVTTALGLERYTEYSAHREALGVAWAGHLGAEASYYGLGESRFATRRGGSSDNIGGRAHVKLAVDLFAPLNERARIYSRVGMYLWEVDVNYNRLNNELDSSRAGISRMVGVGAVYGADPLRVGIELEQVNAEPIDGARDEHRVLFNLFSKY